MSRASPSLMAGVVILLTLIAGGCAPSALELRPEELTSPATLVVGDAAPPLAVSEWVQGQPVERLEPGHVYVLEWWATWCGPCLASMGRSSSLQEKYGDRLTLIAISAPDGDNSRSAIRRTVQERAASIRMRVAIDDGDATTARYIRATRETSVPRAFVVDLEGRLAWIGHPTEAEPVVEAVLAGAWDIAGAATAARRRVDERQRARPLVNELIAAMDSGDPARELDVLDSLAQFDPANVPMSPVFHCTARRIALLVSTGRANEAAEAARLAAEKKGFVDEPWALAELALAVRGADKATSDALSHRSSQLLAERRQMEAAGVGDEWDRFIRGGWREWDAEAYQRLAYLAASEQDYRQAVELQRRAVEFTNPSTPWINQRREQLATWEAQAGTR